MLKSNNNFYLDFIAILFELENYAFSKIAFLGQENVHFVLNILFRWRKLFLAFLDFYFYLFRIFLGGILFKKKFIPDRTRPRPSRAPPAPTRERTPERRRRRHHGRVRPGHAAAPPPPSTQLPRPLNSCRRPSPPPRAAPPAPPPAPSAALA